MSFRRSGVRSIVRRQTTTIIILIFISVSAFGQNANRVSIKSVSHSKNKIKFSLENISNDTLVIDQFDNCTYKKNRFVTSNYTLSNDTLIINWSNNKDLISSPYKIEFYIDGIMTNSAFTILPYRTIYFSIKLYQDDNDNIRMVHILLNSMDKLNFKL